jgi:hypothetical protein
MNVGGEVGFEFAANGWTVGAGQTLDSRIGYTVTAASGYCIDDAALSMTEYGFTNDGGVGIAEQSTPNVFSFFIGINSGLNVSDASLTFAPCTSSLQILNDISLLGGNTGTASVSTVTNLFSQATLTPTATPTSTPTTTPTSTPTPTPTATPTSTPTATPTSTPTTTPTSTPPPIPLGGACTANAQCRSGLCSGGICVRPTSVPAVSSRNSLFFAGALLLFGLWSVHRLGRRR